MSHDVLNATDNRAPKALNVRQTADELEVHENTVRNWEKRGILHGFRLPGSNYRRFPRAEVERVRREMLGSYAPTEIVDTEANTDVKGHVVDGDVL